MLGELVLIHLHGADYSYCLAREAGKHAKAMAGGGSPTAMHAAEMKKHLSAAYTTKFAENKRKGWLCTQKLETPPGTPVVEIPANWRNATI
jgi:hypothetical protein